MPRRRVVAGAAWSCALALLVGLAAVAAVAWPLDAPASEERCPMLLQRESEVPAWLWALAVEPGSRLVDVQDDLDTLEAQATVDDVVYVPSANPVGDQARVYDFGFLPPGPGEEVFTYAPVLCLGSLVPDVEGLDAEGASALVVGSGLRATVAGDVGGRAAGSDPPAGTLLPLGSPVTVSMAPLAAAPEPSGQPSPAGGGSSTDDTDEATPEGPGGQQGADRADESSPAVDPGASTSARTEVARLVSEWGWLALVVVAGLALAWTAARAVRRGRERRWLHRHLRTQARAGTADTSVREDRRLPQHRVRLTPASGATDLEIEERGGR